MAMFSIKLFFKELERRYADIENVKFFLQGTRVPAKGPKVPVLRRDRATF
jgi:hypothetical protein